MITDFSFQGWFNNRDEMLKALPTLVEKLNDYKTHFKNNVEMNETIQVCHYLVLS